MKKAFAWLDAAGIPYEWMDYKKSGVIEQHFDAWQASAGWSALINQRGQTWRKLPETERQALDAAQARTLAIAHPTLVKRPVLVLGGQVIVGFDADHYAQVFQSFSGNTP